MVVWKWWYTVVVAILCVLAGIGLKSIMTGRVSQKIFPVVDGFRTERSSFADVKYIAYTDNSAETDLGERLVARSGEHILICVWNKSVDPTSATVLEIRDRVARIDGVTKVYVWRYGMAIWKFSPGVERTGELRLFDWPTLWRQIKPMIGGIFKAK